MADETKTQDEIDMMNTIQERLFYWLQGHENGVIINQLLVARDLTQPLITQILDTAGFSSLQARVIQLENLATPDVRGELDQAKENNQELQELLDEMKRERDSLQTQLDDFVQKTKQVKKFNSRTPEQLAEDIYTANSKLAPQFGIPADDGREWENLDPQNKDLMIAVAGEVLNAD